MQEKGLIAYLFSRPSLSLSHEHVTIATILYVWLSFVISDRKKPPISSNFTRLTPRGATGIFQAF